MNTTLPSALWAIPWASMSSDSTSRRSGGYSAAMAALVMGLSSVMHQLSQAAVPFFRSSKGLVKDWRMELRICIDVDDMKRAIAFYTQGFGLRVGRRLKSDFVEILGARSPIDLLFNA